ncbi:MAG: hypothetical protein CMP40_00905 [Rickettsiales bacterium]|nr:hypothetical protein [Rickettsiales bacterium]
MSFTIFSSLAKIKDEKKTLNKIKISNLIRYVILIIFKILKPYLKYIIIACAKKKTIIFHI